VEETPDTTHPITSLVMWGGGREESKRERVRNFPGNECRLYILPVDPPPPNSVSTKRHSM
jgi:hypothetical protein